LTALKLDDIYQFHLSPFPLIFEKIDHMELSRFHHQKTSAFFRRLMDKLNSCTSFASCAFLDRQGWYDLSVPSRLLGHYRLFQYYKNSSYSKNLRLPPAHTYIIQRKKNAATRKYRPNTLLQILSTICFFPTSSEAIYNIDNQLVTTHTNILHDFLIQSDDDFETALANAIAAIEKPGILSDNSSTNTANITIHQIMEATPAAPENLRGKQKNIFSKKQVLILFDLLSQSQNKLEHIDLRKPNKFPEFAIFLQALTGKSQETWIEELRDYRNGELYTHNSKGELNQLISTLSNLSEILRKAGFRSIALQADKKIRELEIKKAVD
jgi:hypothetical protein